MNKKIQRRLIAKGVHPQAANSLAKKDKQASNKPQETNEPKNNEGKIIAKTPSGEVVPNSIVDL